MADVVEKDDFRALTDQVWMSDARSKIDVVGTLTSALTPFWMVEREIDPAGELSVVVLPVGDSSDRPTFVLYEENGLVQVSTFTGETWLSRRIFRTCERAVAGMIATACPARSAGQASRTSRTTRARSSVR